MNRKGWYRRINNTTEWQRLRFVVLCFVSLCLSVPALSQSVSATIDRDKILIGEQVTLELKADNINRQSAPVLSWFQLPDTINHFEVVNRAPIDTLNMMGRTSFTQTIIITSFDSGNWQLPPLWVITGNPQREKDTLRTAPLTVQVLPADISQMQDYHKMKDILDVEVKPDYTRIILLSLLAILLTGFAVWFFFLKKNQKPAPKPTAAKSLFETTIEQLEKLGKENPPAPQFYNMMDEICRKYFEQQMYIRAMQLTSDELMIQLNVYIKPESRTGFYQLLRLISAVKFARYQPGEAQKEADLNTAKATVQHIYFHLQRSLPQHAQ